LGVYRQEGIHLANWSKNMNEVGGGNGRGEKIAYLVAGTRSSKSMRTGDVKSRGTLMAFALMKG